jgi:hypothetical protein
MLYRYLRAFTTLREPWSYPHLRDFRGGRRRAAAARTTREKTHASFATRGRIVIRHPQPSIAFFGEAAAASSVGAAASPRPASAKGGRGTSEAQASRPIIEAPPSHAPNNKHVVDQFAAHGDRAAPGQQSRGPLTSRK